MTRIAQLAELLVVLEQENQKLSNENSYLRGLVEGLRQRDRDMDIFMRLAAIRPEKEPEKEEGVLSTPATLVEREERDPLCFEGWEETEEEREEREEQEAEEDRLYGGWETESDEEGEDETLIECIAVLDSKTTFYLDPRRKFLDQEEDEGVLSTPASRSEHMRLCKLAEQYSKIMREEEYWENPRRSEWCEAPPEFYDIAFAHLKPALSKPEWFLDFISRIEEYTKRELSSHLKSFSHSLLHEICLIDGLIPPQSSFWGRKYMITLLTNAHYHGD